MKIAYYPAVDMLRIELRDAPFQAEGHPVDDLGHSAVQRREKPAGGGGSQSRLRAGGPGGAAPARGLRGSSGTGTGISDR